MEHWALELASSPWIYVVMYLFATIDGFFPPIPSESVVIALAAVAVSTGEPNIWLLIPVAAAGAFTGDQIAYLIGSKVRVHELRIFRSPKSAGARLGRAGARPPRRVVHHRRALHPDRPGRGQHDRGCRRSRTDGSP